MPALTDQPVPPPRFVTGTESGTIHATAPYKHAESARAGRGRVACFCGEVVELAPHPPERVLGGWHHYCRVCTEYLLAASDPSPPSPTNLYEPWLCELAQLDTSATVDGVSAWSVVPCRQQRHGRAVLRLKPTAAGIALLAPAPAAASLFTLAEARQLRDALDTALRDREGWRS
ncbi:hypothetical protein SAMN04487904_102378 [Actinopolyspora lacussalsi subsp. righensis]|uniref:Uncharacterized protein n=1 Tax=Actinopolyspora righensis TaxID=995060 RepID=A0A1I6YB96_9ACTN|nr:hypothetical protein [Actinopolyspora righensis]SFT47773.1 hypothetical protein SAMN04487904_102378 [Actinopolyspora righensis]